MPNGLRAQRDFRQVFLNQIIVSEGIGDNLLRRKDIDATLRIAMSNSARIVIVGSDKGGLPIIVSLPQDQGGDRRDSPPPRDITQIWAQFDPIIR